MRYMTAYATGGATRLYEIEADRAWALEGATDLSHAIRCRIAGQTLTRAAEPVPLTSLCPALPLARPGKVLCLGLNYVEHALEGGYEVPDYPALFLRTTTSLVAAGSPMILPNASTTFDYEAELMLIVGRGGRHIHEADALSHVFGYTIFNDGSLRDYQRKTHQWTAGKNFDATGAIGPVVVTAEDLPPGAGGLGIRTRLNDRIVQDSNTSNMIFPAQKTIQILSEIMTLEPGDLIALGTPPGVGHTRKPPLWMKAGDIIEVEIEGIGICRNPIIGEV